LDVDVLQWFRAEEKFPNIQALSAQIEKDVSRLREILESEDRKNL
jgi:FAD synthase